MKVIGETDFYCFMLLPQVWLQLLRCENPECSATHGYSFSLGWVFWSVHFCWGGEA